MCSASPVFFFEIFAVTDFAGMLPQVTAQQVADVMHVTGFVAMNITYVKGSVQVSQSTPGALPAILAQGVADGVHGVEAFDVTIIAWFHKSWSVVGQRYARI